jgi:hypothetical protein
MKSSSSTGCGTLSGGQQQVAVYVKQFVPYPIPIPSHGIHDKFRQPDDASRFLHMAARDRQRSWPLQMVKKRQKKRMKEVEEEGKKKKKKKKKRGSRRR